MPISTPREFLQGLDNHNIDMLENTLKMVFIGTQLAKTFPYVLKVLQVS